VTENIARLETVRDKFLIYRVPSAGVLSAAFIDTLDWPATAAALLFSFDSSGPEDCELLTASLGKKYLGRFLYSAQPGDLSILTAGGAAPVPEYVFGGHKELQDLYLRTEMEYFGKRWADYFPGTAYRDAIEFNARERLAEARIFCVGAPGKPVSLLPLTRIKHFLDGQDTDWVLWAWVDETLAPESRRAVHAGMSKWLRDNVAGRVMTGVHVFNQRSNKFFLKLGFSRKWLQVTKLNK
jgi:hypothetical protein